MRFIDSILVGLLATASGGLFAFDELACERLLASPELAAEYKTMVIAARMGGGELVLADWLREHGFRGWPDFIALHCEFETMGANDPGAREVQISAEKVLANRGNRWRPSYYWSEEYNSVCNFRRGLPLDFPVRWPAFQRTRDFFSDNISATGMLVEDLRSQADLIAFLDHPNLKEPLVSLQFSHRGSGLYAFAREDVRLIATHSKAEMIRNLVFRGYQHNGHTEAVLDLLSQLMVRGSRLNRLEALDLEDTRVRPDELQRLFTQAHLSSLRELDLTGSVAFSLREERPIFGSANQARALALSKLVLAGNAILGPYWAAALANGTFAELDEIDLSRNHLDFPFLTWMVSGKNSNFSKTRIWNLRSNDFRAGGLRQFLAAGADKLKQMRALDLSYTRMPILDLAAFSDDKHPLRGLGSLSLEGIPLGVEGARHLARAKFDALHTLKLTFTSLTAGALKVLFAPRSEFHRWPIERLDLDGHPGLFDTDILYRQTDNLRRIKLINLAGAMIAQADKPRFDAWVEQMSTTTKIRY